MANPEHVELVKQGTEAINKWREDNPDIELDLSNANLAGRDLKAANLTPANLTGANLRLAELWKVNMSGASLLGANLRGAHLWKANLRGADLFDADLRPANQAVVDIDSDNMTVKMRERILALIDTEGPNQTDARPADALRTAAERAAVDLSDVKVLDGNGERRDLLHVDLQWGFLKPADLREANLRGGNLKGAKLERALLGNADLRPANLGVVDLKGENLTPSRKSCILVLVDQDAADLVNAALTAARQEFHGWGRLRRATSRLKAIKQKWAARKEAHPPAADRWGVIRTLAKCNRDGSTGAMVLKPDGAWTEFTADSVAITNPCDANQIGADLQCVKLRAAHLDKAELVGAKLCYADMAYTILEEAGLQGAVLVGVTLKGSRMDGADLYCADLTGADLRGASLRDADVTGVTYNRRTTRFAGINVDTCHGSPLFKRDAQDQDWIEAFREKSNRHRELYYPAWYWLTDCGRSIPHVAGLGFALALAFGFVYLICPGLLVTTAASKTETWITPLYYSIVTFTTLGFGDVVPQNYVGEILVTVEVVLGYVTLGFLIAVLSNTLARRS